MPPQIGRNAPCPCGSGRKFKKCCGREYPPIPTIAPEKYCGFELSLNLPDKPELVAWNFDGTMVLPTEDFRNFYSHIGVTEECVVTNCLATHDAIKNLGWTDNPSRHAILDYSDQNFEAVVSAEARSNPTFEDVAHAFQKSIDPIILDASLNVGFETLVMLHPTRLQLGMAEHSSAEMKRHFALQVFRHEFGHAFGLSFGFKGMSVDEIEMITDAVALVSGWQHDLPQEYFTLFSYLRDYFRTESVSDNSGAFDATHRYLHALKM